MKGRMWCCVVHSEGTTASKHDDTHRMWCMHHAATPEGVQLACSTVATPMQQALSP